MREQANRRRPAWENSTTSVIKDLGTNQDHQTPHNFPSFQTLAANGITTESRFVDTPQMFRKSRLAPSMDDSRTHGAAVYQTAPSPRHFSFAQQVLIAPSDLVMQVAWREFSEKLHSQRFGIRIILKKQMKTNTEAKGVEGVGIRLDSQGLIKSFLCVPQPCDRVNLPKQRSSFDVRYGAVFGNAIVSTEPRTIRAELRCLTQEFLVLFSVLTTSGDLGNPASQVVKDTEEIVRITLNEKISRRKPKIVKRLLRVPISQQKDGLEAHDLALQPQETATIRLLQRRLDQTACAPELALAVGNPSTLKHASRYEELETHRIARPGRI